MSNYEYPVGYFDDLANSLQENEEEVFEILMEVGKEGVAFGEPDNNEALFTVDEIDWLITLGLAEKTGEFEVDRTFWRLTEEGMELAEDYFEFFS